MKRLEGNRRKVASAALLREVKGIGTPRMPAGLTADQARIWSDCIAALPAGLLTMADEQAIERFACAYARWRECQRLIAASGLLVNSPQGAIRNPLLLVQRDAERAMHSAGEVLGLSPVARARLVDPDNSGDDDPMALLLGADDDPNGAWSTGRRHDA